MGANAVNTVRGTRKKVLTMAEYVKREYAIDAVLDVYYDTPDIDLSGEKFEAEIFKIPAADVAPVTRCKDCKYLRVWNQKDLYAFCPKTNFVFLPFQADTRTHFCSLGEPKEGTHADDHD